MPLFRVNNQFHYYAHVPKCGGSSVEAYLKARFGSLAFLNTRYLDLPEDQRWTRSSPQHLPIADFHRLIPTDWVASSFAVVRHPLKRLLSAFQYQVEVEGTVAALWSIDEWFDDWLKVAENDPFRYDNHLRRQSEIVPENATIFRLEDGLKPIVAHLDTLAGDTRGARDIAPENVRKKALSPDAERLKPAPETLDQVARYYAEDFRRFGYPLVPEASAHAAPDPTAQGILGRLTAKIVGR